MTPNRHWKTMSPLQILFNTLLGGLIYWMLSALILSL